MLHTLESLARDYNNEVVVPELWLPPRFDRNDWLWMKSVAQSGLPQDSRITNVQVGLGQATQRLTCMHRTQPRRNFTVFYRRLSQNMIMVLGVGSHDGSNQQYSVEWADGSKSRIRLSVKKVMAPQFLINPIGGMFAFKTLDPLINQTCVSSPVNPPQLLT